MGGGEKKIIFKFNIYFKLLKNNIKPFIIIIYFLTQKKLIKIYNNFYF
jgi:hypothetical protein